MDCFGTTSHLDTARPPGILADEVVDHHGSATRSLNIPELLRVLEFVARDVQGVLPLVIAPARRNYVRRTVGTNRGNAG